MPRNNNDPDNDPDNIDYNDYNDEVLDEGDEKPINAVTLEVIQPGDEMVTFNDEKKYKRYYTRNTYDALQRLAQTEGSPVLNPFTKNPINRNSIRFYTARRTKNANQRVLPNPFNTARSKASVAPVDSAASIKRSLTRIQSLVKNKKSLDLSRYQNLLGIKNPTDLELIEKVKARQELYLISRVLHAVIESNNLSFYARKTAPVQNDVMEFIETELRQGGYETLLSSAVVVTTIAATLAATISVFLFAPAGAMFSGVIVFMGTGLITGGIGSAIAHLGANALSARDHKRIGLKIHSLHELIALIIDIIVTNPVTKEELNIGVGMTENPMFNKPSITNNTAAKKNIKGLLNRLGKPPTRRGFWGQKKGGSTRKK